MSAGFDPLYKWLGIPPNEQPPHCYRLLGLEAFEGNLDVIESAADRQMAYLRTYQTGQHAEVAQEVINQVAVARSWLLNPEKKVQYDTWLREQLRLNAPPPLPPVANVPPIQEATPDLADLIGSVDPYVPSGPRTRKGRRQWMGTAISLAAAVLAVAVFGAIAWQLQQSSSQAGTLEVDWPEAEREGGTLHLDGKQIDVAPGDHASFALPMGPHQVMITRPGYKPYELTVAITPGMTTTVRPAWRKAGTDGEEEKGEPSGKTGNSPVEKPASAKEESDEFSFDKENKPKGPAKTESSGKKESVDAEK